jgi:cytochrome c553
VTGDHRFGTAPAHRAGAAHPKEITSAMAILELGYGVPAACFLGVAFVIGAAGPASAADPAAGRDKARQCQTCHGLDGVGRMPDVPNIGGESEIYLTKQMRDFRSGERRHEQMSIIAGGLSDDDIADLAAYYASIEFTVKVPDH